MLLHELHSWSQKIWLLCNSLNNKHPESEACYCVVLVFLLFIQLSQKNIDLVYKMKHCSKKTKRTSESKDSSGPCKFTPHEHTFCTKIFKGGLCAIKNVVFLPYLFVNYMDLSLADSIVKDFNRSDIKVKGTSCSSLHSLHLIKGYHQNLGPQ